MESKRQLRKQATSMELEDEDLKLAGRFDKLIQDHSNSKEITVADLESRLSKLSADERAATLQELEYRLAKLKGDRPPAVRVHSITKKGNNQNLPSSTNQTTDGQVKNLIRQYTEEVAMDTTYPPQCDESAYFDPQQVPEEATADSLLVLAQQEIKRAKEAAEAGVKVDYDIEKRLKQLHGISPHIDVHAPIPKTRMRSDDLSEEEEQSLIERLTAEAGLEISIAGRKNSKSTKSAQKQIQQEDDELPWCVICNEDATLRCSGCEGDLYCRRCFKEGHDNFDLNDHKALKFTQTAKMELS